MRAEMQSAGARDAYRELPNERLQTTPLRGLGAEGGNLAHVFFALGMPCIVSGLHAHPNSGAVAKQLAESNRHGRRHRFALAQYVIEMLAGNAEKLRNLGLGPSGRRNYVLPQQRPGMGRAPIRIALDDMSHDYLSFSDIAESLSGSHRHLRIRR